MRFGSPAAGTPRRSSAATSASSPARNASSNVRLMKPGPAISTVATPSRSAAATHRPGDVARVAAELLGKRQRAVGLRVGAVGRAHDRIDAGAPGDRVERRLQAGGEDVERISHRRHSAAHPALPSRWSARRPDAPQRQSHSPAVARLPRRLRRAAQRRQLVGQRGPKVLTAVVDLSVIDASRWADRPSNSIVITPLSNHGPCSSCQSCRRRRPGPGFASRCTAPAQRPCG